MDGHSAGAFFQGRRGAGRARPAHLFPIPVRTAKLAQMQYPSDYPSRGRVLAVDDCAAMREIMRASLESFGYSVHSVDSGWAALEAAGQTAFDAIVLDVEMPGLDGLAVGRALRSDPRHAAATIAMYSSVDEEIVRAGFTDYDAYVPKACSPVTLGECVDGLIRGRRR